MTTPVVAGSRLLVDDHAAELARAILPRLRGATGFLSAGRTDGDSAALPPELGLLLQQVLEAVADGRSVSVSSVPTEVTTSTAAAMLGVSRPTLMKLVRAGEVDSHKVGSHTRLLASDVLELKRVRRERERAAFRDLLALEDALGEPERAPLT